MLLVCYRHQNYSIFTAKIQSSTIFADLFLNSDIIMLFCRAQDQASMQLSEMEEEMDQRIQAAERKTREQVRQTLSS